MTEEKEKIIIYAGGGNMSGCYGAGVFKGMHDLSLMNSVEAIYSGSVGTINTAYLLSNQTDLGPTVYWENLQDNFIFPSNILWGTLDLLKNRFIKRIDKTKVHNVVNIDHIYNILSKIKPLNLDVIKNNPIDFYIKILNVDTGELEYKSFRDHPTLDLLKAAITLKPYYFDEVQIARQRYIDGVVQESLGIQYLLDKYPNRKILVIMNEPIKRSSKHYMLNGIGAVMSSLYPYKISLFKILLKKEGLLRQDIKTCINNKNILLLYPNFSQRVRPRTTSTTILKRAFNYGIKDAEKILSFVKNNNTV